MMLGRLDVTIGKGEMVKTITHEEEDEWRHVNNIKKNGKVWEGNCAP